MGAPVDKPYDDSEMIASSQWLQTLSREACDQILWHRKVFAGKKIKWTRGRCREFCRVLEIEIGEGTGQALVATREDGK